MNLGDPIAPPLVDWGWAGRALDGVSGDLHVVVPFPGGTLVALIDGLGHGPEAAEAAQAAAPILRAHAGQPLGVLVQRCHEGLRRTRGAVMTVVSFDASGAMAGVGVGNVDAVLFRGPTATRADAAIALRSGVVGFRLPPLHVHTFPVERDDTLIMVSDGIRSSFMTDLPRRLSPQELAESILARFTRGSDDAHVVVARYLGGTP